MVKVYIKNWNSIYDDKPFEKYGNLWAKTLPDFHNKRRDAGVEIGLEVTSCFSLPCDSGIFWGSSRGASRLLEKEHEKFLSHKKISPSTSPKSTLSHFSTSISSSLKLNGPSLSMSSACATSLNSVGVAYSMIKEGHCNEALAGGSEGSLSSFTLEQLAMTGAYAEHPDVFLPFSGHSGGFLAGEGAAVLHLTTEPQSIEIKQFKMASESEGLTGLNGSALKKILSQLTDKIDLVIPHASGTQKGDRVEYSILKEHFGLEIPFLPNKKTCGHMLGAAGAFSIVEASKILTGKKPFLPDYNYLFNYENIIDSVQNILIIGLGFGGNTSALLLSKCENT